MSAIWARISDILIRWRVWFVNSAGAILLLLPELLNAPEVIAVVPQHYQKYVFAGALLLNILMRPRAAARATDPETIVRKAVKASDEPVVVTVTGTQSETTHAATVALGGKA